MIVVAGKYTRCHIMQYVIILWYSRLPYYMYCTMLPHYALLSKQYIAFALPLCSPPIVSLHIQCTSNILEAIHCIYHARFALARRCIQYCIAFICTCILYSTARTTSLPKIVGTKVGAFPTSLPDKSSQDSFKLRICLFSVSYMTCSATRRSINYTVATFLLVHFVTYYLV